MTLFIDEEEPPQKTKLQIWLRRIFYGLLLFAAFVWISLRMLMNLGGDSDALRQGFEKALTHATGLPASIRHFNSMTFYPDTSADMADITFSEPVDKNLKFSVATVGSLKISMDFWALFLMRGQIKALMIHDIDLKKNAYLTQLLHIDSLGLENDKGQAGLAAKGRYGDQSFQASLGMTWVPQPGGQGYFIRPDSSSFSFQSSSLTIQGTLTQGADGLYLTLDSLGTPEKLLTGKVTLRGNKIDADLHGGNSAFVLALQHDHNGITGSLRITALDLSDGRLMTALGDLHDFFMPIFWSALADRSLDKLDLDIQAENLLAGGVKIAHFSLPLHTAAGVLTAGPLTGEIAGGALQGQLTVDSSKLPVSLTARGAVHNLQYGPLEQALAGRAGLAGQVTAAVTLSGEARLPADLPANLKGEAALVGGVGDMAVALFDSAAPGLAKALLPRADAGDTLHLSCLLADFGITGGAAKADPLFIGAAEAAFAGTGSINLAAHTVDLTLAPAPAKAQNAAAAQVTGSWTAPAVKPAAGAPFPAIHPSFLSFSLADLGLDDKHPCRSYVGKGAP